MTEVAWEILDVRRLALRPDDIVVLRVNTALSEASYAFLVEKMSKIFPEHKVIVLQEDAKIYVITPGEQIKAGDGVFDDAV